MQIRFFGTGSCLNPLRGNLSFWAREKGAAALFDCGERTYHQIMKAGENPNSISGVFITHNHGDHIAGLPTLMFGMHVQKRRHALQVCGPEDIDIGKFYGAFYSNLPVSYPVEYAKMGEGERVMPADFPGCSVSAVRAEHGLPALMFKIETPLKKVFYTGDTQPTEHYFAEAEGADLLIHDCTYLDMEKKGQWGRYSHSSAREAGYAASKTNAKMLALVQMAMFEDSAGARLKQAAEEAASEYRGRIIIPNDFDTIDL